jgi:enediyne biosynthesis protein E4
MASGAAIIDPVNRRQLLRELFPAGCCSLLGSRFISPSPSLRPSEVNAAATNLPHYVDVARQAGLVSKTVIQGRQNQDFLLSTTGGGVAVFDYDNDGWLDIFLVNGWGLDPFSRGQEPTNRLYRNNHDGTFTDVSQKAGLVRHGWGQGACVGDYDNDGNLDLFVTYYGQNVLYRNNGDGTFTDVTQKAGLQGPEDRWSTGAAFLDYDRDGYLDLFVSNYVGYKYGLVPYHSNPSLVGEQSPVLYGVAGLEGTHNLLYHNNGNGTFSDLSRAAGLLKPEPAYSFTPLVADFDNDRWPDVYVADDSTPSLFFRNNHDGTFTETGLLAGVAFDPNGRPQGGMGVDAGDYDGDGLLDIIKTNFSNETPSLYHNDGKGFFTDVTYPAGLAGASRTVKWGTAFFDCDNDGLTDIVIVTGPIYPPGINAQHKLNGDGRTLLYRNRGNDRFEDVSGPCGLAGLDDRCGRGLALGDIFHTGQIDLVINNVNDSPSLLRSQSPSENFWLLVRLVGSRTNRAAIGSRVIVQSNGKHQIQEVRSGGSFCSQNDLRLHFGLGRARQADRVEVCWLSGAKSSFEHVPANRLVMIQEDKGIISQDSW